MATSIESSECIEEENGPKRTVSVEELNGPLGCSVELASFALATSCLTAIPH